MKCEKCGFYKPLNPLKPLAFGVSQLTWMWLIGHWHADNAAFLWAQNYFGACLTIFWWFCAISGVLSVIFGVLGSILALCAPDEFYSQAPK